MNVDDAVRQFRRSVPGPSEDLIDRIIVAVTGSGRAPSPRRRRPTGRGVLVVGSVAAAAVVLVTAGLLIRGGEGGDAVPAAPLIPAARVDWGQIATVRLKPDPGISIEEMRERFTKALAFRTHDHDGAGVEVLSTSGDEATVRLPGAQESAQVKSFLRFGRVAIVDEKDVVASGTNITALKATAAGLIEPSTPVAYYVQGYLDGAGWSGVERYPTRAAAEARVNSGFGDDPVMIAVPADMVVVGGDVLADPAPVALLRQGQYLPSRAIRSIAVDGTAVTLSIDPAYGVLDGHTVRVLSTPQGEVTTGPETTQVGMGTVTGDGRVTVDSKYPGWTLQLARPDIGGSVDVAGTESYGTVPSLVADPLASSDAPDQKSMRIGVDRWVHLLSARFDDRDYILAAGLRDATIVATMVTEPGRPGNARGAITSGPDGRDGSNDLNCPEGVGTPRVVKCGGAGGGGPTNGRRDGPRVAWMMDYGRVSPDVARIVMEYGGVRREAVIKNGWWLAHITVDIPAWTPADQDKAWEHAVHALGRPRLSAWDTEGNPVPISPPEAIRP